MANEQVAEAWLAGWKSWIANNLPGELEGFGVIEATEEGERPEKFVMVALEGGVERVPGMEATGRVSGVILLREPIGAPGEADRLLATHRANVADLWEVLKTVKGKPGTLMPGVFLHDVRWQDRETAVIEDDRVTGFPVSNMATSMVTV